MKKKEKNRTIIIGILIAVIFFFSIQCFYFEYSTLKKDNGIKADELTIRETNLGNISRIDYVDTNGSITYASDKHYATVVKRKDERGNIVSEYYYDESGDPAEQILGHYGIEREYNELGQNVKTTYVDAEGKPTNIIAAYAAVYRFYDKNGNALKETFVDENFQPTLRNEGYCSWVKKYNELDQCTQISYLDERNELINKKSGYAIEKRTLDKEGRVRSVAFFGTDGEPATGSLGQFGEAYGYDTVGRQKQITFLNQSGKAMMNTAGYAIVEKTYSNTESGDVIEFYYDTDHKPVRLSHGQYGMRMENGAIVYLNIKGDPIFSLDQFIHIHAGVTIIAAFVVCFLFNFMPRTVKVFFLIAYTLGILYLTLVLRDSRISRAQFELFWSYKEIFSDRRLRKELLQNIWLFVPFGMLLRSIAKKRRMMIIPLGFSAIIEIAQYATGRGLFEFDDIISNGIGGCIGFWCAELAVQIRAYRCKEGEPV